MLHSCGNDKDEFLFRAAQRLAGVSRCGSFSFPLLSSLRTLAVLPPSLASSFLGYASVTQDVYIF